MCVLDKVLPKGKRFVPKSAFPHPTHTQTSSRKDGRQGMLSEEEEASWTSEGMKTSHNISVA